MSSLLEDITSRDTHRIWSSSCEIAVLRDETQLDFLAAHLAEIKEKTEGVELGGGFFPNAEHLRFAIRKLEFHKSKKGCLCLLYPHRLMYNPAKEEEAGNIRILETVEQDWAATYVCRCALCGTTFKVQQGEYHYTWWEWKIVK